MSYEPVNVVVADPDNFMGSATADRVARYVQLAEQRGLTVETSPYEYTAGGVVVLITGDMAGAWLQVIVMPSAGRRTRVSAYYASVSGYPSRRVAARHIATRIGGMHPKGS